MRFAIPCSLLLAGASLALAQNPPANPPAGGAPVAKPTVIQTPPPPPGGAAPRPAPAPATAPKSMGRAQRLQYLYRQLELTADQRAQADALVDSVTGGIGTETLSVEKVREIWGAIQQAQAAGDQAAIDRYTKQLQDMGKGAAGEIKDDEEILQSLRSILTDSQKKTLDRLVGWLTRNPSGLLRPVDLFDIVREIKLSDGQVKQLAQVEGEMRRKANEQQANDDKAREALASAVTSAISAILTPEQRPQFDSKVKMMTTAEPAPAPAPTPSK